MKSLTINFGHIEIALASMAFFDISNGKDAISGVSIMLLGFF